MRPRLRFAQASVWRGPTNEMAAGSTPLHMLLLCSESASAGAEAVTWTR
jgi:hypothetical protein